MSTLNVLVVGSTGYIGVQLIKLLIKHKYINIKYLCGNSSVGKKISNYEKSLTNIKLPKIIKFNKKLLNDVDVVFTALPNGEAQNISKYLNKKNILIDLGGDFRLKKASEYLKWYKQKHRATSLIKKSIYSLPEINGQDVKKFNIISCPGCYPTSILLPLVPLIKHKLIKLLIKHRYINIKYLCGNSSVGKKISNYEKSLTNIKFIFFFVNFFNI